MITEMEFKSKTRRYKDDAKKGIREWTTTLEQSFRVETKWKRIFLVNFYPPTHTISESWL